MTFRKLYFPTLISTMLTLFSASLRGQSVICEEEPIILKSNAFRGIMHWEISSDGNNWIEIGTTQDTILQTAIFQSGNFTLRGRIEEGDCEPVITNLRQLQINPLPPLVNFIHPDSVYLNQTFANLEIEGESNGMFSILSGQNGNLEFGFNPNIAILEGQIGERYQVEYRVTNNCGFRADTVDVAFCSDTLRAIAGPDMLRKSGTSAILSPTLQTPFDVGHWSILDGSASSLSVNTAGQTVFHGQSLQAYTLLWTVANGCGTFYDTLQVSFSSCPSDSITFQLGNQTVTYGLVAGNFNNGQHCWMDRNLGAQRVAESFNDSESYGFYYQWGRLTDGHQISNSPNTVFLSPVDNPGTNRFIRSNEQPYDWRSPQNNSLWQSPLLVNNPCPEGWRVPTRQEWINEGATWSPQNRVGAFNSPLKIPASGFRSQGASLLSVGSSGNYWSSTIAGQSSFYLTFGQFSVDIFGELRAVGLSIRCIKD